MSAPGDEEVREALEAALAGVGLELAGPLERRPSPYRTSFPIEELRAEVAGRGSLRLGFKRLDWDELEPGAVLAKPTFLHDPDREPSVYRSLLPAAPPGPPEFFGAASGAGRSWLFVEWVEGRELFQVGERELWEEAARWLARFHLALAPDLDRHRDEAGLVEHDAAFYRRWIERAERFAAERDAGTAASVARLGASHEAVVAALLELPRTVLHGEFYASNVIVAGAADPGGSEPDGGPETRVAAVDWELAAVGTGLSDLAALVSGWPAADREAIAAAYAAVPGVPAFTLRDLDLARLQVAVQWLGWAPPGWAPPENQRHDWLAEAIELAEGLDT
jgi:aminoglycoside phosphotransferase (APT) family kinase protein